MTTWIRNLAALALVLTLGAALFVTPAETCPITLTGYSVSGNVATLTFSNSSGETVGGYVKFTLWIEGETETWTEVFEVDPYGTTTIQLTLPSGTNWGVTGYEYGCGPGDGPSESPDPVVVTKTKN